MYQAHWGLSALPFLDDHDPRFFFESSSAREALARLGYAVRARRGTAVLGGPPGAGKSAVARRFAGSLKAAGIPSAVVAHPALSTWEFLREAARQLAPDVSVPADPVDLLALLRQSVAAEAGAVLVVDPADRVAEPGVWESIRWLAEREGEVGKVGAVLVGPVEDLSWTGPLSGRVVLTCAALPMDRAETERYVAHRVAAAGGPPDLFDAPALDALQSASQGICRRVNQLADLSLFVAYGRGARTVGADLVAEAASGWAGAAGAAAGKGR